MKIVGMLPVFNDEDIVEEVIQHLLSQDIELVILDNGSTDKTYQICENFLDKGLLKLERFQSDAYRWTTILRKLYDMAIFESPDWVLRSDSDEFLETGIKNLTLKDGISQADAEGYNLIQFNRFDFFMTDNDLESGISIKEKLRYYSYQSDFAYRSWKFKTGINPMGKGLAGHCPIFPYKEAYKIYPKKFVMRHYNLRNKTQALNKIQERISRRAWSSEKPRKTDHIDRTLKYDYSSPTSHTILTKYNEDNQWNFSKKYTPFIDKHPTKEQLFSNDGFLKSEFSAKAKEGKTKTQDAVSENPTAGTFFIKKNYLHRLSVKYFDDNYEKKDGIVFQPYVIPLAEFLGGKLGCKYLIDLGCGNAQKLVAHYPKFDIIGVDFKDNIKNCKERYDFGTWIEFDFDKPHIINLSADILKKSIIICSDIIEHLENPIYLLNNIKKILDHAPICLITTPEREIKRGKNHFGPPINPHHIREWNSKEFETLLQFNNFNLAFMGLTISNNKDNLKETIVAGVENNKFKNSLLNIKDWNYPHPDHFMLYDMQ